MTPLKLTVIGCGYLGAVHAAAMAHLGHHVLGIDTRSEQVDVLSQGRAPFYEPGLPELLITGAQQGDLRFTSTPTAAELAEADVHFIAVGTPQSATGGEADLSQLWSVVDMLHDSLPEGGRSQAALDAVYQPLLEEGIPRIVTDYPTAELVKTAANSFLATKISFINAMAHLCDTAGADVTVLADAIGHDPRIGKRFLQAGAGFGGGCLPKDIRALQASADLHGARHLADLLGRVDSINREQRNRIVDLARAHAGGDFSGKAITILGAAFKPLSDDVRDSPALDVASRLADLGAEVTVCDPQALPVVARSHPHLTVEEDPRTALKGAELVLLLTEWDQFVSLDPADAATDVAERVIIDGRNALDPAAWRWAGWTYAGVGR